MDPTSGRDNDTAKSPSPPDVMAKSTNMPQSKTTVTGSGSRQATTGPTSQGRLSYAAIARKAASNERPDGAAGASPGATSIQPSQTRKTRPADNQSTVVPAVVSRDREATARRGDISRFGVDDLEVDAQSRASQVSPRVAMALPLVIITNVPLLQPADADARNASSHPISSPKSFDISAATKEVRTARHEGVTSPGPISSMSSMQRTQPRPGTVPSPPPDVLPSQGLRDAGGNIPLEVSGPEERREKNESPRHQADPSRERNATRPLAQRVDHTSSVQSSAKPSAPSPPLSKQPSASTSPLPSLPAGTAPAMTKMASSQKHPLRGAHPQAPSRETSFESPRPAGEDRGKGRPEELGRKGPSAAQHRPPAPLEHTPATMEPSRQGHNDSSAPPHRPPAPPEHTPASKPASLQGHKGLSSGTHGLPVPPELTSDSTELPSQQEPNPSFVPHRQPVPPEHNPARAVPSTLPQPVSGPLLSDRSNSRLQGSDAVQSEAKRAAEGPTSDKTERRGVAALEEQETRPEVSATSSDGAKHRKAEPNPPTGYTHKKTPTKSSVERTYSNFSRGDDSSVPRSSELGESRGKLVQSPDLGPSLGIKETHSTRPPPLSTQSQPNHVIAGVSLNSDSIGPPRPAPRSRTPSVAGDSRIPVTTRGNSGKLPSFLAAFRLPSNLPASITYGAGNSNDIVRGT